MKKAIAILAAAALFAAACAAQAGDDRFWCVHYSIRGAGRDITIVAQSSAEARRLVAGMFPGTTVTGVRAR
jgi:predicted small secreted protein